MAGSLVAQPPLAELVTLGVDVPGSCMMLSIHSLTCIKTRILRSGSKAQDKRDSRNPAL